VLLLAEATVYHVDDVEFRARRTTRRPGELPAVLAHCVPPKSQSGASHFVVPPLRMGSPSVPQRRIARQDSESLPDECGRAGVAETGADVRMSPSYSFTVPTAMWSPPTSPPPGSWSPC
jgi:hypothetical protein